MIENKVKDLAMIYNFVGDNFFIRSSKFFKLQIFKRSRLLLMNFQFKSFKVPKVWLKFWRFEIQIYRMTSDGEMNKIKLVDLD